MRPRSRGWQAAVGEIEARSTARNRAGSHLREPIVHVTSRPLDGAPLHYERHRPEQTTRYRLARKHAASFIAHTETRTGAAPGASLPPEGVAPGFRLATITPPGATTAEASCAQIVVGAPLPGSGTTWLTGALRPRSVTMRPSSYYETAEASQPQGQPGLSDPPVRPVAALHLLSPVLLQLVQSFGRAYAKARVGPAR